MSDTRSLNQNPVFKLALAFLLSLVIFISVVNTLYIVALIAGVITLILGIVLAVLLYFGFYNLKHS